MFGLITDARDMIRDLQRESPFMRLWGPALNAPHVIGGLVFIMRPEAALVLVTCVFSVVAAAQIHKRNPFSRLTSVVHIVWLPLLPMLVEVLAEQGIGTIYGMWLAYVVATMGISLVLDIRNVGLYFLTSDNRFETQNGRAGT